MNCETVIGMLKINSFHEQLRKALKNYNNPHWLGLHSPLATPYFLGVTQALCDTTIKRGEALRHTLHQAAKALWPDVPTDNETLLQQVEAERQILGNSGSCYYYLLLDLRFFRHHFPSRVYPKTDPEIQIYLSVSKARFFKHLKAAIQQLEAILLTQTQPTFRLEYPRKPPIFIGREEITQHCFLALQKHKTVALTGMSGSGKTTLGMFVAMQWPQNQVFWFTIRPTLNDQLSALLFSLGYFLHQLGASALWQQLVADAGKIDNVDLLLGLVRYDLDMLQPLRPLLCFDEINQLHTTANRPQSVKHIQILEFIKTMKKYVPLLLIGEQTYIEADYYLPVTNLQKADVDNWFKVLGLIVTSQETAHLHAYTNGNPRLLLLCITLYHQIGSWPATIDKLPTTAALTPVFHRTWHYLPEPAQQYLQQLATFRRAVPADLLPTSDIQDTLLKNQLIYTDQQGALFLIPALHDLIYQTTPVTKRKQFHLQAAMIRQTLGEYTAVAYHYCQGGEPGLAIEAWYPHKQREIHRGKSEAALIIFEQIVPDTLQQNHKQALGIIRAELHYLKGQVRQGLTELNAIQWTESPELEAQAQLIKGEFLNTLGYPHQAQEAYHTGINVTTRIIRQLAKFRYESTRTHIRQRDLEGAWQEVQLARYEVENLQGILLAARGQYPDAHLAYQQALALAMSVDYKLGIAKTHRNLGIVLGLQGKFDKALMHSKQAVTFFEQIGDQLHVQLIRRDIAGTYLQMQAYEEAIDLGEQVLHFFEQINDAYMISNIASDLAEAYFEVEKFAKAAELIHYGLQQEEAYSRPYLLYTLGRIQYQHHQFDDAVQQLQQVIDLARQNEDKFIEAYGYQMLGKVYLAQTKQTLALDALRQALSWFKDLGIPTEVQKVKTLLAGACS